MPIRGLLAAETKIVLDRLAEAKPGETVTYNELNMLTKCDVRKRRHMLTTPINKLLSEQARVFVANRGLGLRLLFNSEIPSLGQRDLSRVRNVVRRSARRLATVDYNSLSPELRIQHNSILTVYALFQRSTTTGAMRRIEEAVATQSRTLPLRDTLKLFGRP